MKTIKNILLPIALALIAIKPTFTMEQHSSSKKSIPSELLNGTKRSNEKTLQGSTVKTSLNDQLIEAVSNNHTGQIEALLTRGADANAENKHYEPALILAIENENEAICKLLIAAGANLEMDCSRNLDQYSCWPPLTTAARIGNEQICKLLIESGVMTNKSEPIAGPTDTALWHAVYNGHIEIVKLLMQHGAPKPRSNVIKLPLLPSIEMHKNFKEMQELLKQYNIALEMRTPSQQSSVESYLTFLISKNYFGATKKFLQLGIDVNFNGDGDTPLHYAVRNPYYWGKKMLKLLLKLEANPNAQNKYLETPLMHACGIYNQSDEANCKLLLTHGAEPHLTDHTGNTALIFAAKDRSDSCHMLLEYQKNQEKKVITMLLCLKHHQEVSMREIYRWNEQLLRPYLEQYTVKALLAAKNNEGKCAYDYYNVDYLKPNTGKETKQ